MDNKYDDLWQGGSWERPAPPVSPPAVPLPGGGAARPRPVLRQRRRRRRWPWAVGLGLLLPCLLLLALHLDSFDYRLSLELPFPPPAVEEEQNNDPARFIRPNLVTAEPDPSFSLSLLPEASHPLSFPEIYEKCLPSVVSLTVQEGERVSSGSGVVLSEDGYIITNAHLVSNGDFVEVTFSDGRYLPAMLVGFAPSDDLAVLKVAADDLIPAEFGDSTLLRCGDSVSALGSPLGYQATFTDGIVSALDREVTLHDTTFHLIQTSAAINHGSSGGALINQYGQVVGITSIKLVSSDGSTESMCFAIPSLRSKYVVDTLMAGREVRPTAFGVVVTTLPVSAGGLEVLEVVPGTDAHAKGLRPGDRLVALDGAPILSSSDLARAKQSRGPGDTVTFTYVRGDVESVVEVALMDADTVTFDP